MTVPEVLEQIIQDTRDRRMAREREEPERREREAAGGTGSASTTHADASRSKPNDTVFGQPPPAVEHGSRRSRSVRTQAETDTSRTKVSESDLREKGASKPSGDASIDQPYRRGALVESIESAQRQLGKLHSDLGHGYTEAELQQEQSRLDFENAQAESNRLQMELSFVQLQRQNELLRQELERSKLETAQLREASFRNRSLSPAVPRAA